MFGKKSKTRVYVKLLQNGFPIAACDYPMGKRKQLDLTSSQYGDLSIPLYPLPCDIQVLQIEKDHVELFMEEDWRGIVSSQGRVFTVDKRNLNISSFQLVKGDYASLAHGDIRILVRISEPDLSDLPVEVKQSRAYRKSIFSLFLPTKSEQMPLIASLIFFGLLFSIILAGPHLKGRKPLGSFEDLGQAYVLPFLHGDYLKTSPEALQENLDRRDYVKSVFRYYRGIIDMLVGTQGIKHRVKIPVNSTERYKRVYRKQQDDLDILKTQQKRVDEKLGSRDLPNLVSFAAVKGEPLQQKILRMLDKMDLLHKAHVETLKARSEITPIFRKEKNYEWMQWEQLEGTSKLDEALETMSKNAFGGSTNEEAMYLNAIELGNKADSYRKNYLSKLAAKDKIEESPIIVLPAGTTLATFLAPLQSLSTKKQLENINASLYGEHIKTAVQEPLIGRIDKRLVLGVISRKRFQLEQCYRLALNRNQQVKGSMQWEWEIDTLGNPKDLTMLNSTIQDQAMQSCIKRKLSSWKFPLPQYGSVRIDQTFTFTPQSEGLLSANQNN